MNATHNTLIIGATSGIARAVAHECARRGNRLILAARDQDELGKIASDFRIRYEIDVKEMPFDALRYDGHETLIKDADAAFDGGLDGVIVCHGSMVEQDVAERDFGEAKHMLETNFVSAVSVLQAAAKRMEQRGRGYLACVSSVAGDRGRQSNFVYGAAKAGLSAYLQGLRNRLHSKGVHVLTIKPGFVDTAMTRGKIKPTSPLLASPERVARDILRGIERRRNVVYTPWFWRCVMLIIRLVPEPIFKRLRL